MLIDLTMPFGEKTPVYPGDQEIEIGPSGTIANEGWLGHTLKCDTHNGTHLDAPGHMIEGGAMLNAYSLDRFVGRGRVLDIRKANEPALSEVNEGDIVLLYTGFSETYAYAEYYEQDPNIPVAFAQALVDNHVSMVGVDAGSIDPPPFLIHKALLGGGVMIIENLVNIAELFGKDFEVFALPLNTELEASPARVIARTIA